MRLTSQRLVILEELRKLTCHPTADELYGLVRQRLPHVSLGTVYRNLDLMSKSGLVLMLPPGGAGGQARYDGNVERHDHVRCTKCGCVADLGPTRAVAGLELPDSAEDFQITDYRLEYLGICPACRE